MLLASTFFLLSLIMIKPAVVTAQDVVRWVYMLDAEPINWLEDGVAKGVEVEIVEYVLGNLGIRVKHEFYPWERAQQMVRYGKADAMMTTPTKKRFEYSIFGKEKTLINYWSLFIQKGNRFMEKKIPELKRIEDLKPFGLLDYIGNGWTRSFLKARGNYKIQEVAKIEQIPIMLSLGRGDLTIQPSSWINWWIAKHGLEGQIREYHIDWPFTQFHFVFMVSRKSPWMKKGLLRAMDEELKRMKKNGKWLSILKKYKNPYAFGRPFRMDLNKEYEEKHGFYKEYNLYPIYTPSP